MAGGRPSPSGSFSRRLITSRPSVVMARVQFCDSSRRSTSTAGSSRSQAGAGLP